MNKKYDVVIIGSGVSGTSLLYMLSRYTNIKKIAIVEKYSQISEVNSHYKSNSQTLHQGDIETNYSIQKAKDVFKASNMIINYCKQYGYVNNIIFPFRKMVLGVGDDEIGILKNRYKILKNDFSFLKLWTKDELSKIEPNVVYDEYNKKRAENIIALGNDNSLSTVNYGLLAKSFVDNSILLNKNIDIFLDCYVDNIVNDDGIYKIINNKQNIYSDFVVVDAGSHSLFLAHKMGYGHNYSCIPMMGNFFMSNKKIINSKIYTVQNPKLPFAALHADPDISSNEFTRFGPTAFVSTKLEKNNSNFIEFYKTLNLSSSTMSTIINLLKDKDISSFMFRNILFNTPFAGKRLFLKYVRKIIPSLQLNDLSTARDFGGIRPQLIDKNEKCLLDDESSIKDRGIIFNMIPSPGATGCLGKANKDALYISLFLGKTFNEDLFKKELLGQE